MRLSRLPAVSCVLALILLTGAASAQTKVDQYSYHFDDEQLIGDTLSGTGVVIIERKPSPRIMLLRPRASFVAELLESVEAL